MQAYAVALAERIRSLDAPPPTSPFNVSYAAEFDALLDEDRRAATRSATFETACHVNNAYRNRYFNVLANEHSRVKLKAITHAGDTDYINANVIQKALLCNSRDPDYYATQAPVPETFVHFWQMIYEARAPVIVTLTSEYEAKSALPKVDRYWPANVGACEHYGPFLVENIGDNLTMHSAPFIERRLLVRSSRQNGQPLHVTQLQYVDWPDQDVPESPDAILELRTRADELAAPTASASPVVVHCSAGVGRTGTYIAIDLVLRRLRSAFSGHHHCIAAKSHSTVSTCALVQPSVNDISTTVRSLKLARSKMVQTAEQYRFIFHAVLTELKRMSDVPDSMPAESPALSGEPVPDGIETNRVGVQARVLSPGASSAPSAHRYARQPFQLSDTARRRHS